MGRAEGGMDADRVIEVDRDRRGEAAGQRTEEAKGDSVRGGEGGGIGVVLGGEPNTLDGHSSLPRWSLMIPGSPLTQFELEDDLPPQLPQYCK